MAIKVQNADNYTAEKSQAISLIYYYLIATYDSRKSKNVST